MIFTACKAQIAVPLYKADHDLSGNVYFKDLDHDLDKFVGTWEWQNGNDILTIIIQKKNKIYNDSSNFYEDLLVGEYKYIENGIELMNTLPSLQDPNIVGDEHKITGNIILHKNHPPKCLSCSMDERRVLLAYLEPLTPNIYSEIILRHIIEQGVEKIELRLFTRYTRYNEDQNSPQHTIVPNGEYTLIKQE